MSKAKRKLSDSALPPAAGSLACYAAAVHPGFEMAAHSALLIDRLEGIERAQSGLMGAVRRLLAGNARLLISEPPRHGKTSLLEKYVAWYLGRRPERSVIYCTYGQSLSDESGRRIRNLMTDALYQAIFPRCRLSADSTSQCRFETTAGGSFYAVGRGGPITGRGCSLLICDDLLKDVEEARSETIRRGLHEWFSQVAYTRLTPDGAVIIAGTRWHEDDLTGWLLREHASEGWELLNLPALAEANDPLGRAEGDALWAKRFDRDVLDSIRRQIGSGAFVSLYQGHPVAAAGGIFKREWIRTYSGPLPSFQLIVMSVDTAFKTGKANDYSVITVWGKNNSGVFLLALWRGKVEFPQLRFRLVDMAQQWKPHAILIEDAASGQSLIQELKAATPFPVLARRADRDKVSRATAVTAQFESNRVFLPEGAPWLADFVDELCVFPHGVHDDQVDSAVQALNYLRQDAYSEPPPFEKIEREGFFAQLRWVLARPSSARTVPGGFYEERPILPELAHELGPAAARAATRVTNGEGDTVAAMEEVMWDSVRELSEE